MTQFKKIVLPFKEVGLNSAYTVEISFRLCEKDTPSVFLVNELHGSVSKAPSRQVLILVPEDLTGT